MKRNLKETLETANDLLTIYITQHGVRWAECNLCEAASPEGVAKLVHTEQCIFTDLQHQIERL